MKSVNAVKGLIQEVPPFRKVEKLVDGNKSIFKNELKEHGYLILKLHIRNEKRIFFPSHIANCLVKNGHEHHKTQFLLSLLLNQMWT